MLSKDAKEEDTESEYIDEAGPIGESSKKKKLKKFDYVTERWINVVKGFYKAKIEYDKYYDKMLNRRVQSRITNCDVLRRNRLITLKVYKEDGTDEVTPDFKASDFHLTELEIDFNKPLSEQAPLDKINDLARKKRKHADDIHDYFRSTKKFKSLVKYEDHPAGTMLNDPCLGMILFNSVQRQDFVTIEDFGDFSNEMLYTGEIVGSVAEPFSLSVDLRIKSPKYKQAEDNSACIRRRHFSCSSSEAETKCFTPSRFTRREMQTPFLSAPRSLKIDLSLDKDITQELTGVVQRICRHQGMNFMISRSEDKVLNDVVPKIALSKKHKAIPLGKNTSKVGIEPQPVESTQGTNKTPNPATVIVDDVVSKKKKGKHEIHEATLLSLPMHKTAKATEDQENMAIVLERILEEDIEKMLDDDDDSECLTEC
ncbi:hypothetical protein Tco_0375091 [Tanacetum coccineum]